MPILGDVRVTVGGHSIDWFWKPLEALPSGRGDDEGERHYRELLAENPVRDALEMLEISLRR